MNITKKSLAQIKKHAAEAYPEECCGVLMKVGQAQIVKEAENEHPDDRTKYFKIPAEFYKQCMLESDSVLAIYHSHPGGPRNFSQDDIAISEVLDIPIIMMEWPKGYHIVYEPKQKGDLNYLARPFVLGILDCYTLIRDYYRRELEIDLPALQVSYNWWEKGENLYLDNISAHGVQIDKLADIQVHDVILMCMEGENPEHGAIYVGKSRILHHPIGKLSRHSLLSRFYQEKIHSIWRHKSLYDNS